MRYINKNFVIDGITTQSLVKKYSTPIYCYSLRQIRENIKRGNLSRFKKYIDLENPNRKCFITNEILDNNDLSIDHVIPWSYLFSDDLWNLVYVKKSENSSKSNRIPNEEMISKLEKRNVRLLRLMEKENTQKEELRLSIDKNFVREFWYGCKG